MNFDSTYKTILKELGDVFERVNYDDVKKLMDMIND